jgi:hypothetical protein
MATKILNFLVWTAVFHVFLYSQDVKQDIKVGDILVYPLPSVVNEKEARYAAYAVVDVDGNYEDYYKAYKQNTKSLEDEYFSRKVTIFEKESSACYQLLFTQWFIGELFRLQEDHEKQTNSKLAIISRNLAFEGQKEATLWKVQKYLLPKTKSSWVGEKFRYLDAYIAFIDMGKGRTRIFYRMALDAHERRSVKAVEQEAREGIANILKCKK